MSFQWAYAAETSSQVAYITHFYIKVNI